MQWLTFIACLTFWSFFLCLCHGAPPTGRSSTRANCRKYSSDEELFIINEMRGYPGEFLPIWGREMWIEIAKNHCKMRESNPSIFPSRTDSGIKTHFQQAMLNSKGKVPLPNDLRERIPKPHKKKRVTFPPGSDHPGVISGAAVKQGDHVHDISQVAKKYTPEEHRFIVNFLKNNPRERRRAFCKQMWIEAAEQHRELRKADPTHFPHERSSDALRLHTRRTAQMIINKRKKKTDADKIKLRYTKEERDFIIKELLEPTCTSLYSALTWGNIKARHDSKVQSKVPGFDVYRSAIGMKSHFVRYLLWQRNEMSQALREKFPHNFSKTRGETSNTQQAGNEDSSIWDLLEHGFAELQDQFELEGEEEEWEEGEEDSCEWDGMIEELLNTPFDVQFDSSKGQK